MLFFFTKLDQMSRVGSRGRHPKCRPNCSGFVGFGQNVQNVKKLDFKTVWEKYQHSVGSICLLVVWYFIQSTTVINIARTNRSVTYTFFRHTFLTYCWNNR